MNRRACALVASLLVVVACGGGQNDRNQSTPDASGVPPANGGGGNNGSDASVDNGTEASAPLPSDGGKVTKPKAIGSTCATDSECEAGLSCNATYGICTKACTADAECAGKKGAVGGCVDSLCFAACVLDADGGVVLGDGGKTKAVCKDKTFDCVSLPGKAGPLCLPNADGGNPGTDEGGADTGASD